MHIMQSRRDFLSTLSAAGAAGVFGARTPRAGEAPPETSTALIGGDPPPVSRPSTSPRVYCVRKASLKSAIYRRPEAFRCWR
jgi:hypothetical protein